MPYLYHTRNFENTKIILHNILLQSLHSFIFSLTYIALINYLHMSPKRNSAISVAFFDSMALASMYLLK